MHCMWRCTLVRHKKSLAVQGMFIKLVQIGLQLWWGRCALEGSKWLNANSAMRWRYKHYRIKNFIQYRSVCPKYKDTASAAAVDSQKKPSMDTSETLLRVEKTFLPSLLHTFLEQVFLPRRRKCFFYLTVAKLEVCRRHH